MRYRDRKVNRLELTSGRCQPRLSCCRLQSVEQPRHEKLQYSQGPPMRLKSQRTKPQSTHLHSRCPCLQPPLNLLRRPRLETTIAWISSANSSPCRSRFLLKTGWYASRTTKVWRRKSSVFLGSACDSSSEAGSSRKCSSRV